MHLSFGAVGFLLLKLVNFVYGHTKEAKCADMSFLRLTKFRALSPVPMSWEEASECCQFRDMILHTLERADEDKSLRDGMKEAEKKMGQVEPFWTSAKWNDDAQDYQWFYGKGAGPEALANMTFQRERYHWLPEDIDKPSEGLECVAIQQHSLSYHVTLTKRDCDEKRHFICQAEPQRGGHDMSLSEAEICESATLDDYHQLPNGMYFRKRKLRWRVARYCCERLNMTLAANFMEEDKHRQLYSAMSDILGDELHKYRFWTSLNDLCYPGKWMWICGEEHNSSNPVIWRDANPDNYNFMEDCGEFKWLNSDSDELFSANDMSCDSSTGFICDAKPPCRKEEQWDCPQPPRKVDITPPTAADCKIKTDPSKPIEFKVLGNSSKFQYSWSSTRITWIQARFCADHLKCYQQASFQDPDEIEFFTNRISSDRKIRMKNIWTTATTWKMGTTDLTWPDGTKVDENMIHNFSTIGDITPICGKIAYYSRRVAVMTEDCTKPMYFACKTPLSSIIDPNPIPQPCFLEGNLTIGDVCPDSQITIQRPNDTDLERSRNLCTQEELHKLRFQNRKLLETVVDFGTSDTPFMKHKPISGFELYTVAADIYKLQCPDVPAFFIEDAFHYFHRLHYFTSQERTEQLENSEFTWALKLLERCKLANVTEFKKDKCGEWIISVGNCSKDNYICPDSRYQFNITKYDPLVEIMWKIFELTHAVCFKYFHESYRMFHKYSQAIMDVFSNSIRLRMDHQLEDSKFWERVLGPQYELYLINMDRCNEAAISSSDLPYRLHYTTLPKRVRLHGKKGDPIYRFEE